MTDNINILEAKLSNYLDDLLVANNIEKPRPTPLDSILKPKADKSVKDAFGFMIMKEIAPRIIVKIEIFSNEIEEPHFKITYKNCSCRFKFKDCSMMPADCKNKKAIQPILKIKKYIIQMWDEEFDDLRELWLSRQVSTPQPNQYIKPRQKTR